MRSWRVDLQAISDTHVVFIVPVTGIPANTAQEAGALAIQHAIKIGVPLVPSMGMEHVMIKPAFAIPMRVDEEIDGRVQVFSTIPEKDITQV